MDKATAEKLVLDRWRALPREQRANMRQALDFADGIAIGLSFETLGNPRSIIRAWVAREFQKQETERTRNRSADPLLSSLMLFQSRSWPG